MNIRYSYLQNSCELPLTDERPALFMGDITFVSFVPFQNKDKIKVKLILKYARGNSRTTAKSR